MRLIFKLVNFERSGRPAITWWATSKQLRTLRVRAGSLRRKELLCLRTQNIAPLELMIKNIFWTHFANRRRSECPFANTTLGAGDTWLCENNTVPSAGN